MSFYVSILKNENCDKCKLPATKETPLLNICTNGKGERHIIFVHERCLIKAIDKAKKEAAG